MSANYPFFKVWVDRPDVDYIHLSHDDGLTSPVIRAWKSDGFKAGALARPDIWETEFEQFIAHLSDYIGSDAKWTDGITGKEITAWEAISTLARPRNVQPPSGNS